MLFWKGKRSISVTLLTSRLKKHRRQVKVVPSYLFLSCKSLFVARQHERPRLLARRRFIRSCFGDVRGARRAWHQGAERAVGHYRATGVPSAPSLSPIRLRPPDVRVQQHATRSHPCLPTRTGVQLFRKTVRVEMLCVSLYSVSTSVIIKIYIDGIMI